MAYKENSFHLEGSQAGQCDQNQDEAFQVKVSIQLKRLLNETATETLLTKVC